MTSHAQKGANGQPTGFYVSEAAPAWKVLQGQGIEVDFASPPGGEHVEVDGRLVTGQNPTAARGLGMAVARLLVASEAPTRRTRETRRPGPAA